MLDNFSKDTNIISAKSSSNLTSVMESKKLELWPPCTGADSMLLVPLKSLRASASNRAPSDICRYIHMLFNVLAAEQVIFGWTAANWGPAL